MVLTVVYSCVNAKLLAVGCDLGVLDPSNEHMYEMRFRLCYELLHYNEIIAATDLVSLKRNVASLTCNLEWKASQGLCVFLSSFFFCFSEMSFESLVRKRRNLRTAGMSRKILGFFLLVVFYICLDVFV